MPSVPSPLRIVIVEDNPVLLDLLTGMLVSLPGVDVVGHASSETEAITLLRQTRPDFVIVDLELRAGTGLKVLGMLQNGPEEFGAPRVVVFSNHAHQVVQSRCLSLGAEAFFDKSFQMDELLEFIQHASGQTA